MWRRAPRRIGRAVRPPERNLRIVLLFPVALVVALLGLPCGRTFGAPPDPDAKALARKRLVEQAGQAVRQGGLTDLASARENIEKLRASVRADWEAAAGSPASLGSRLTWLLALEDAGPDPARPGAFLAAVWFGLWVAGEEAGGRYAFHGRRGEPRASAPRLLGEAEWKALAADERIQLLRESVLDLERTGDHEEAFAGPLDLRPSPSTEAGGAERGADPVAWLRTPPAGTSASVLVHADELADEISEAWLRVRDAQVREHVEAWADEQTSQLLTDEEMTQRTQRVEAVKAELARIGQRETRVLAALNLMVQKEMDVNRRIFQLDGRLEAAKEAEAAGGPPDTATPEPARLRLEQTLAKLERHLLYLTVVRAQDRLALYERARNLVQQERVVAETVRDRLLQEVRRERRVQELTYLANDRGWLQANREQAVEAAAKAGDADREAWQAYIGVLDDLVRMSGLLTQLVRLRQDLEARVAAGDAEAEPKQPASGHPPAVADADAGAPVPTPAGEGPPPGSEVASSEAEPESAADAARRRSLGTLLHPRQYVHRLDFTSRVRDALPDPLFDADLVARTYTAVDDYVVERNRSLGASSVEGDVQRQYEALESELPARLEAVARRLPAWMAWDVGQIREKRQPYAELRERTAKGIREERRVARRQIADLEALRRELMNLGAQSLAIRVDRSLDAEGLRAGGRDVLEGARGAFRWLTFEGEPHIGTFLSAHWRSVAAALLLGCLLTVGIRIGRRRIDRSLERIGARTPTLLPQDLTVGNEAAEAKRTLREEREAAEEAEATVIRDTSGEDLPRQSPTDAPGPDGSVAKDGQEGAR